MGWFKCGLSRSTSWHPFLLLHLECSGSSLGTPLCVKWNGPTWSVNHSIHFQIHFLYFLFLRKSFLLYVETWKLCNIGLSRLRPLVARTYVRPLVHHPGTKSQTSHISTYVQHRHNQLLVLYIYPWTAVDVGKRKITKL
jgi:hypothetical protein